MKKINCFVIIFILCFGCFCAPAYAAENAINDNLYHNSVVKIDCLFDVDGQSYTSSGSGVIIDNDLILTVAHYIPDDVDKSSADLTMTFQSYANGIETSNNIVKGKIVYLNSTDDIMLIESNDLKSLPVQPISVATTNNVKINDMATVVGYSEGYNLLSGKILRFVDLNSLGSFNSRYIQKQTMQVDVNITEGMSGGAVINTNNEIIGITGYSDHICAYGINLDVINKNLQAYQAQIELQKQIYYNTKQIISNLITGRTLQCNINPTK